MPSIQLKISDKGPCRHYIKKVKLMTKLTPQQKNEQKQAIAWLKHFDKNRIDFSNLLCEKTGKVGYADIYDPKTKIAIEISEIYDDGFEPSNSWIKSINNFKKAIKNHSLYKKVKGLYFVSTPKYLGGGSFQFQSQKDKKEITKFLQLILKTKDESKITIKKKYAFKIKKLNDTNKNISFSQDAKASWIDDVGIFYQGLKRKIKTASKQLERAQKEYSKQTKQSVKINKKIFLIVSKTVFYQDNAFSKALLRVLDEEKENISNIDEIWIQTDTEYGQNPTHQKLYYQKDFFNSLVNKNDNLFTDKIPNISVDNQINLFKSIFLALIDTKNFKDICWFGLEKLLITVKQKPHKIFKKSYLRSSISQVIEYLTQQGRYKQAWWLVDQIIDDPDPAEPGTLAYQKIEPQFNYDLQISNNDREKDNSDAITTVRGHLVWAIKKLIIAGKREDPKNLFEGYRRIKHILDNTKNKYLILQCLYALSNITNQRWWFLLNGKEKEYRELRQTLLGPKDSLTFKYSKYHTLADGLVHVLNYLKDLNTDEMIFVLKNLLYAEQGTVFLIYFAIYRTKHYQQDTKDPKHREVVNLISKYNKSTFDYEPAFAQKLLSDILDKDVSEKKINQNLQNPIEDLETIRSEISWQFWKIVKEQPEEFENLKPWISKLYDLPYETNLYHNLELMLLKITKLNRKLAFQWFKKLINNLYVFIINKKDKNHLWHDLRELITLFEKEINLDKQLNKKIEFLDNSGLVYIY